MFQQDFYGTSGLHESHATRGTSTTDGSCGNDTDQDAEDEDAADIACGRLFIDSLPEQSAASLMAGADEPSLNDDDSDDFDDDGGDSRSSGSDSDSGSGSTGSTAAMHDNSTSGSDDDDDETDDADGDESDDLTSLTSSSSSSSVSSSSASSSSPDGLLSASLTPTSSVIRPASTAAPQPTSSASEAIDASTHLLSLEELAAVYSHSRIDVKHPRKSEGLSTDDAERILRQDGRNVLTPPRKDSILVQILKQFTDPFLVLLILAGVLSTIAYVIDSSDVINLYVTLALFGVVLFTGLLSFFQQRQSSKVMNMLGSLLALDTKVMRGGKTSTVPAADLVAGDLVELVPGSKCPADVRLIHAQGVKVEVSALTGESEPVTCDAAPAPAGVGVLDARCIVLNGALVLEGVGFGLVVRTGDRSMVGQLAMHAGAPQTKKTTMQIEIAAFVRFVAILAIAMATIFFGIGVARRKGEDWLQIFVSGFLVVIVANVPQGLPATVTSLLTVTAKTMADRNVSVKRLDAIESLGSTTIIASDKTGTLTSNQMTVTEIWMAGQVYTGIDFPDMHKSPYASAFSLLHLVASRCNAAQVNSAVPLSPAGPQQGLKGTSSLRNLASLSSRLTATFSTKQRRHEYAARLDEVARTAFLGNSSDIAVRRFATAIGAPDKRFEAAEQVFEIPFNSVDKFHLVVLRADEDTIGSIPGADDGDNCIVLIKGAAEQILERCTTTTADGSLEDVDETFRQRATAALVAFASRGRRVISFAVTTLSVSAGTPVTREMLDLDSLCFLGMSALIDPPREDVPLAIVDCRLAGVRVFMVTGDHAGTASAIARQIGIIDDPEDDDDGGDSESDSDSDSESDSTSSSSDDAAKAVTFKTPSWTTDPSVPIVVNGHDEVQALTSEDWDTLVYERDMGAVFARMTPEDKLLIVNECMDRGQVVTVTGDGVNDAPALRAAHVGVAMGMGGSDVAREAADVVLLDDSFASLVEGIRQGRRIFDNLKKTIAYTLTHLAPEILPVLLALALGIPPGLSSLAVLSIDLITELAPAVSLAYEAAEGDVMARPPRNLKTDRLVTKPLIVYAYIIAGLVESIFCLGAFLWVFASNGISASDLVFADTDELFTDDAPLLCSESGDDCLDADEQVRVLGLANAAWYITLVVSQAGFHLWTCKTMRASIRDADYVNLLSYMGSLLAIALMVIFAFVPGLQDIMGFAEAPAPALVAVTAIASGITLLVIGETRKFIVRNAKSAKVRAMFEW